jgi:hypothetical protein
MEILLTVNVGVHVADDDHTPIPPAEQRDGGASTAVGGPGV